jgi:hypothetical protein
MKFSYLIYITILKTILSSHLEQNVQNKFILDPNSNKRHIKFKSYTIYDTYLLSNGYGYPFTTYPGVTCDSCIREINMILDYNQNIFVTFKKVNGSMLSNDARVLFSDVYDKNAIHRLCILQLELKDKVKFTGSSDLTKGGPAEVFVQLLGYKLYPNLLFNDTSKKSFKFENKLLDIKLEDTSATFVFKTWRSLSTPLTKEEFKAIKERKPALELPSRGLSPVNEVDLSRSADLVVADGLSIERGVSIKENKSSSRKVHRSVKKPLTRELPHQQVVRFTNDGKPNYYRPVNNNIIIDKVPEIYRDLLLKIKEVYCKKIIK